MADETPPIVIPADVPDQGPPPAKPKVDVNKIKQVVSDQVKLFLKQTGRNVNDGQTELQSLMAKIAPQMEEALMNGDDFSLELLRDRVAVETARVSLQLVYRERQTVASIISTAVQVATMVGMAAL